jgi:hypothetical protein
MNQFQLPRWVALCVAASSFALAGTARAERAIVNSKSMDIAVNSRGGAAQALVSCTMSEPPKDCAFAKSLKVEGSWKDALIERPGKAGEPIDPKELANARNNLNLFLKHVPVVKIPKGTELLHVTKSSDWVKKSMVGANNPDAYSFFTLSAFGYAGAHSSDFKGRLTLRLTQDVYAFFCPHYGGIEEYKLEKKDSGPEVNAKVKDWSQRMVITKREVDKGGELAAVLLGEMHPRYAPAAFAGCRECELVFYNSVIPTVMVETGIATSVKGDFTDQKIVDKGELPPPGKGIATGLKTAPDWMGPSRAQDVPADVISKAGHQKDGSGEHTKFFKTVAP